MDLLEELRNKSTALNGHSSLEGVKAAIRHVEVAERYFVRARGEREDDLFNDVIYRTNQTFEGMLKEAYTILANQDGSKLSPYQIEKHLLDSRAFAPRVMELFTNYRQQWRNPSTHDHKLFFGEQEALLAITSVLAFANILLNQMIEKVHFKSEQEEVERKKTQLQPSLRSNKEAPLHEEIIVLLELFSEELFRSFLDPKELSEIELIGRLHGFIESLDEDINVVREPKIGKGQLRPDILIQKNNQEVVVEVKRAGSSRNTFTLGFDQVKAYLVEGKFRRGILYIPPAAGEQIETNKKDLILGGREVSIYSVIPKQHT